MAGTVTPVMRILRATSAFAAAWLLLLVAGCATTGDSGDSGAGSGGTGGAAATTPAYAADRLVLRVERIGGLVPPSRPRADLPMISVYGDGRFIEPGPVPAVYPGPALPNVQVRRIPPAGLPALIDAVRAAGVDGSGFDFGRPPIADATTTRFTVANGHDVIVVEVYALGESGGVQGLTAAQVQARNRLRALLDTLSGTAGPTPTPTGLPSMPGDSEAYRPTELAALSVPWTPDPDVPNQAEITWPGPALPGERGTPQGAGCVTAGGADTAEVLAAAERASAITPWVSGGKRWRVALRPLLPDESGCADLR